MNFVWLCLEDWHLGNLTFTVQSFILFCAAVSDREQGLGIETPHPIRRTGTRNVRSVLTTLFGGSNQRHGQINCSKKDGLHE